MPTPISQRSLAALRALNIAAASAADTCHRTARDLAQSLTQKCGTKPMAHSSARCKTNPIEANEKPLCQPQNEENDATAATAGCKTNPFAESIGLLPIGERNPMAHSRRARMCRRRRPINPTPSTR